MAKEALLQTMWLGFGDDGILRMRILENAVIDLEQAKLLYATVKRMGEDKRYLLIIDARFPYKWEKDAQQYTIEHSEYRIAAAIITNNPISRLITNTYVRFFKPPYPVKIFSGEEKAIPWLREKEAENKD